MPLQIALGALAAGAVAVPHSVPGLLVSGSVTARPAMKAMTG